MILDHKSLTYQGKVIFEKVAISSFKRMPKLFEANEACFMFLLRGEFKYRTPDRVLSFHEGDSMVSKCGNYYFEDVSGRPGSEVAVEAVGAYFHPEIVKQIIQFDVAMSSFRTDYDACRISINPLLDSFKDSLNYLLENPSLADDALILTKLKELLILLTKTENAPSVRDYVASLFQPYEYDFKRIIGNNTYSNLSLGELSHLCSMSTSTFKRKFKALYHTSPAQYFLQRKLEKAVLLLINTDTRITDIIFDCGFESISSFNRCFKKQYNVSPSEYRLTPIGQMLT